MPIPIPGDESAQGHLRTLPYLHLLWQGAFQHTQAERMMKQEDASGAHTGSCKFGDDQRASMAS